MSRFQRSAALLVVLLFVAVTGCDTPDAIAKFCTVSNTTLTSAQPIFADVAASCMRRKNLEHDIGSFTAAPDDKGCNDIAKSVAAGNAVKLLAEYFTALNSIATFDTKTTSKDAATLASGTTAAFNGNAKAQKAVSDITELLMSAGTNAYRLHWLNTHLKDVSSNVSNVTDALKRILTDFYFTALDQEEAKLWAHYQTFAQVNRGNGAVIIQLDDRWRADHQAIEDKRAAALKLIAGLDAIKGGLANLVTSKATSVKAKELPALLDPYITELQTLIPQIQKAF